jgi:CRISPR-associated protein Csx17
VNELSLDGCTPEPLMGYLKALGVLRLVSEQKDSAARGWWEDGVFKLNTRLDEDGLVEFFRDDYKPTPIVVPWSGGDFFAVQPERQGEKVSKTPTASAVVEAFLSTDCPRLDGYRRVILHTLAAMRELEVTQKAHIEGAAKKKVKAKFLARLRSVLPDEFLGWLDAAAQLSDDSFSFNALLGSGGGSDGNTHFSDNFMQNLWDCLPDFDSQRTRVTDHPDVASVLFGSASRSLRLKRTASLFDSGAVGGPNAGVGLERESLLNPWNFILALEGCICLAGAVVKRQQVSRRAAPAFPFAVRMTATGFGSGVDKEQGQNEIWMPLWHRSLSYSELELLLETGRCEVGRRTARTGLDFARAVAGLGVDTGIDAFARYAIVRGRVGGDNYNTAVSAGLFAVKRNSDVGLLEELDAWLDQLNGAIDEESPARFRSARLRIETAIFEFCKYGGPERAAQIVCAIGAAERELSIGGYAQKILPGRSRPRLTPLSGLSAAWLAAANDGSSEFKLARGLAFLNPGSKNTGSIRLNLEPVERDGKFWVWGERGGHVVWSSGDLARNLGAVVVRRLIDSAKNGEPISPFGSSFPAALLEISEFLNREIDDEKLEDLIWGLSLIDGGKEWELPTSSGPVDLPRAYALMKLTLLPGRLSWKLSPNGDAILQLTRVGTGESLSAVAVKPEPAIAAKLRAGDVQGACEVAVRRLQASGFNPIGTIRADGARRDIDWGHSGVPAERLLAALLFPVADSAVNQLADLVLRRPSAETLV